MNDQADERSWRRAAVSALIWLPWRERLTTEAKISSDMPLPMPRWVMISPIHISSAVPVVRVSTTSSEPGRRCSWGRGRGPVVLPRAEPAAPVWNR